jgi:outer membrane protein OmpA-like peptidoglycan-associated protein
VAALFVGLGLLAPASAQAQGQAGGSIQIGGSTGASGAAGAAASAPAAPAAPAAPGAPAPPAAPKPAAAPAPALGVPADAAEAPSGDTTDADEAAQAAEWAARDVALNEANTITGGSGLLHTQHAQSGEPPQFRLGLVTEWYTGGFLCTDKFPCPALPGHAVTDQQRNDSVSHFGTTISLGTSLFKGGSGVFDAYASTEAMANSDSANVPGLLQVLGDTNIGIKYAAPLGDWFHLGGFAELWLINGTGAVGLDGNGTSAKFGAVGTADLRGLESHTPVRISTNIVYSVDNTGDVVTATEQARMQAQGSLITIPVTRIERYGLAVNRVDHFDFRIGGEFFVADDRARPFIEADVLVPFNRQGYLCHGTMDPSISGNPSGDHCLFYDKLVYSTLTIGSRFYPWKKGFSLLAALDIALSGSTDFVEELQPIPPWMLFLGAGWAVDTQDRPPVIRTKVVEKVVAKVPATRHVVGFVHEKDKNDPVQGAIVTYRDRPDLAPLATSPEGKFADDVPPGKYTYDVKADGYKPGSADVTVPKEGSGVAIDVALDPLPRVGSVTGHVRDALTSEPVAGVQVILSDPQHKEMRLNADSGGGFKFEGVAPGTCELSVTADGYLAFVSPADVKVRQDSQVDILLRPTPKKPNVVVGAKEITIKQQIQFALDSAVILPDSFGLLTEIADTLIRHTEIKRVEVQGHTDNSGTPEHNKTLSEQRADAVVAWLAQHGVSSDKLVAHGYGQEKPLVPNVTAGNRAQNRRVQFIIMEKEGAPPPANTPAATPAATPTGAAPAAPAAPAGPPPERKKNPLPGF